VKTGEFTDRAVRSTAIELAHPDRWVLTIGQPLTMLLFGVVLRHATTRVTVPVSERAWRRWRARLTIALALVGIGTTLLVVGVVRGDSALVVFAAIALVAGAVKRVRAWNDTWISLQYQSASGRVVVSRVSTQFDEQAKRIFTKPR